MKILSINQVIEHETLDITTLTEAELRTHTDLDTYDYIIINGGDGTIRRVIKTLHVSKHHADLILNPTGSFNVIAKMHKVPMLQNVLTALAHTTKLSTQTQQYYTLNEEVFLFSAGNMGDLQHIALSESLRFGLLKTGIAKYVLALLFLLPLHIIITPFMLLSDNRFFIFTPASFITKFGSFYGKVDEMTLELESSYNHLELDGDIVTIESSILHIKPAGKIRILTL